MLDTAQARDPRQGKGMKKVMREGGEIGVVKLPIGIAIGHGGALMAGRAHGHPNQKRLVTLIRISHEKIECPNSI